MTELYDFLIDKVFIGFLRQAPELLEEIEVFKGDLQIINNNLVFTLPALFELTCHLFEKNQPAAQSRSQSDYLLFRKQLYCNPTNTVLQKNRGVVEIEKSAQNHDDSVYKLSFSPNGIP